MPFEDYAIGGGKEERKSMLQLYGVKALQGMQYKIGDELKVTLTVELISKEEHERNSFMPSKSLEFEVKSVEIEEPLKTKLKDQVF